MQTARARMSARTVNEIFNPLKEEEKHYDILLDKKRGFTEPGNY